MKLVTFNLRCQNPYDGHNEFVFRCGSVLAKIATELPDVIGFQEALPGMVAFLANHLPQYHFVGRPRAEGDEQCCIAYRADTVDLYGLEVFWLSPTPYVPASRYEHQSGCPRVCSAALLRHRDYGVFRFYNTHLDHIDDEARCLGMNQILARIAEDQQREPWPYFLCGDMNCEPGSTPIQAALDAGLTDLTDKVEVTYHEWGTKAMKIDYIFASEPVDAAISAWKDEHLGIYLTDHYPVCAEL